MQRKIFLLLFFFSLFFTSFASENKIENLPKKEITRIETFQKKNVVQFEKQKLSFKERLALKLIKRKIKKVKPKSVSSNVKMDETLFVLVELGLLVLVLTSVILSIISFLSANILVGFLLLLIAALFGVMFLTFAMIDNEDRRVYKF